MQQGSTSRSPATRTSRKPFWSRPRRSSTTTPRRLTGLSHDQGLTNLADYAWNYDTSGRLTSVTTVDGTDAYTYDDEGNRTRKTTKPTGAYVEYEWDHRNRLTRVEFRTSGGTLNKAVEYGYDHADRRIAKRVDDNADSTWDDQERFVYDGEDLTMVYDETGTPALEGRYLHGPGIDTVLAYWQPGVPKIRWTFTDRLGSVRDVIEVNGSSGRAETAAAGTDVPSW